MIFLSLQGEGKPLLYAHNQVVVGQWRYDRGGDVLVDSELGELIVPSLPLALGGPRLAHPLLCLCGGGVFARADARCRQQNFGGEVRDFARAPLHAPVDTDYVQLETLDVACKKG